MKRILKDNYMIIAYALITVILELLALGFVGVQKPILTKPFYSLILFLFTVSVLFAIKSKSARLIVAVVFITLQSVMLVGFTFLYYMNGTEFSWSMISQRFDARGTLEKVVLEPGLVIPCLICIVGYAVVCGYCLHREKKAYEAMDKRPQIINGETYDESRIMLAHNKQKRLKKLRTIISLSLCGVFFLGLAIVPFVDAKNSDESYISYLYDNHGGRYQQIGVSANTIYEALSSPYMQVTVDSDDYEMMEQKLFEKQLETSEYFGVSRGNNLVYILVESWEWYPYYNDWYDYETAKILYPNLTALAEQSLILSNFYQREKTDTAEMLSLLGTNPTGKYTNYSFENNKYPFSLPNLFRSEAEGNGNTVKQLKSFHQNTATFYNRDTLHKSVGFDELVGIEKMEKFGVDNTWITDEMGVGERTLDSITMEKMKGEMFPSVTENEQFMTFWLTFSMHGYYVERQTLKEAGYYDKLDELGVLPAGVSTEDDYLRTYCATVMDFDKAIGYMMEELSSKNLLGNTTICMYSDHNTYYNNLSYHAKGIELDDFNEELYRIPCLIYDQKLRQAMVDNGETVSADNVYHSATVIDKFTTTSDLIPTLLDIFGIKGWDNLYFGSSVFTDKESIIYSRAYSLFVTDEFIGYSLNGELWSADNFDKADFIARAEKHLNKLELIDKVYYGDYFDSHEYKKP